MTYFFVQGDPVPKQSYRAVKGGGYIAPRVKAWQHAVGWYARDIIKGEPSNLTMQVDLIFYLAHHKRVDCDNLSKCVLDALNGIAWLDDAQVVDLHVQKVFCQKGAQGVRIEYTYYPT